jgi:hypothetical protein
MKNFTLSAYFLLLFSAICFSQSNFQKVSIEKGWKGIKPLNTTKLSVNKLLGVPEVDDNEYYGYASDEAFVQVNYSTAPCQDNQYKRGKFNVSKDTVLGYDVHIKQRVKLSEIKFNREKYIKDTSGDVANNALYINEEDGVWIGVWTGISQQENDEYIGTIYFKPSKKNAEKFKCKD